MPGWGPAWHSLSASGPTAASAALPGALVRDGVCLSVSTGVLFQPTFGVRKTEGSPVNQMCWGMSAPVLFKEAPTPWEREGVADRLSVPVSLHITQQVPAGLGAKEDKAAVRKKEGGLCVLTRKDAELEKQVAGGRTDCDSSFVCFCCLPRTSRVRVLAWPLAVVA